MDTPNELKERELYSSLESVFIVFDLASGPDETHYHDLMSTRCGTEPVKGEVGIPAPQQICGRCRKPIDMCGCCPTDDGPGQAEEKRAQEADGTPRR